MSNIEPTPFGDKYVLVEHIATGGMAEIYRATYAGIEGFAKELVVKTLREDFAARPDVVDMFLDEARVAATIQATVAQSCMQPFEGMITEDLHQARFGSNGVPAQDMSYANARVAVDIARAPTSQPGVVFFGFTQQLQPFLGWTLVPSPDLAIPLAADAAGDANYSFPVQPSFPMGIELFAHSWFLDPSGFFPYAVSNATRALLIKP